MNQLEKKATQEILRLCKEALDKHNKSHIGTILNMNLPAYLEGDEGPQNVKDIIGGYETLMDTLLKVTGWVDALTESKHGT